MSVWKPTYTKPLRYPDDVYCTLYIIQPLKTIDQIVNMCYKLTFLLALIDILALLSGIARLEDNPIPLKDYGRSNVYILEKM